jgi:hypothetical protein
MIIVLSKTIRDIITLLVLRKLIGVHMCPQVFRADSIQAAAERILVELKEGTDNTRSISSRNNVIYFDGWGGLGASAVLRAVAQRLAVPSGEAPAGLQFDQIIHVDCSKC